MSAADATGTWTTDGDPARLLAPDPAVLVLRGCRPGPHLAPVDRGALAPEPPREVAVDVTEACARCRDGWVADVRGWCADLSWPSPTVVSATRPRLVEGAWERLTGLDRAWLRWCPESVLGLLRDWDLPTEERHRKVAADLGWLSLAWAPWSSEHDLVQLVQGAHRRRWSARRNQAGPPAPRAQGGAPPGTVPDGSTLLALRVGAWSWLAASVGSPSQVRVRDVEDCLRGLAAVSRRPPRSGGERRLTEPGAGL